MDSKEETAKYQLIAKSQLKKIQKIFVRENYKEADANKREQDDFGKREKNLEEAKQIVIEEDKSLPEATKIKINQGLIWCLLVINLIASACELLFRK